MTEQTFNPNMPLGVKYKVAINDIGCSVTFTARLVGLSWNSDRADWAYMKFDNGVEIDEGSALVVYLREIYDD